MASTGVRPRSAASPARTVQAWTARAAVPWTGLPPRAVTTWARMPLTPVAGLPTYMTVWLAGSRSATAARIATVFPVPTSPVTMAIVLSATAQAMRAAASPQSRWRCSREGGRSRPNGMRASPNRVTTASIIRILLLLLVRGRAAVDGGELLLGAAEVAGQGGGGVRGRRR